MTVAYYREVLEAIGLKVAVCITYAASVASLDREAFALAVVSQEGCDFEARVVLERTLGTKPAIPTLVVTRRFSLEARREAIELGAVGYLKEPVTVRQVVQLVKAHLNL